MTDNTLIAATQTWLKNFIIEYNICPFAQREQQRDSIRYVVCTKSDWQACLELLIDEIEHLDHHPDSETTLLILAEGFSVFDDYLDFLTIAEQLLIDQGYEGIYQLASFHPTYCFEGSDDSDAANYTNRSPHPMLHIIRETSIERALIHYPNPETIPQRNMELARRLGLSHLQSLLKACG